MGNLNVRLLNVIKAGKNLYETAEKKKEGETTPSAGQQSNMAGTTKTQNTDKV